LFEEQIYPAAEPGILDLGSRKKRSPRAHFDQVAQREKELQSLRQALTQRVHRLLDGGSVWGYGGAQPIWRLEHAYLGASDPRKDGQARAFETIDA
jgi:gamma-glutamyltranspeptidase